MAVMCIIIRGALTFQQTAILLAPRRESKKRSLKSLEHINDYPQVGCTPLKKAIAEYENTKPDQVICGNGAAEVIFSLCRAVNPRRALVPLPTLAEYQQALYSVDRQVVFSPEWEKEVCAGGKLITGIDRRD